MTLKYSSARTNCGSRELAPSSMNEGGSVSPNRGAEVIGIDLQKAQAVNRSTFKNDEVFCEENNMLLKRGAKKK